MSKRFALYTLGCKTNLFDSVRIAHLLKRQGYTEVSSKEEADVYIVNSCTVTESAAAESKYAVRKLGREHEGAKIIMTGCFANIYDDELQGMKNLAGVYKSNEYEKLVSELTGNTKFDYKDFLVTSFSTERPFLKVQDGCNSFCSYCIIPYARGRSRSVPKEQVIDNFKLLIDHGYKEVILTGIHLGMYGRDSEKKSSLLHLIQDLIAIPGDFRIRLSSIEPQEVIDEIIDLVATSEKLCKHFHIPLQSGSDAILKKMNRHYTRSFYTELIEKINKKIPNTGIGVDVISGFPGESEEDFSLTYNLMKELNVSYGHVFPYSDRERTRAARYSNKIEMRIKEERAKVLRELFSQKKIKFYHANLNKKQRILVESKEFEGLYYKGFTENYIPVYVNKNEGDINHLLYVNLYEILLDKQIALGKRIRESP